MSKIEGRPLYDSLKDGTSDVESLERLGSIIRSLHEAGVSHGDLTTHNVIVSEDGQLHLIDFGLARQIGSAHVCTPVTCLSRMPSPA